MKNLIATLIIGISAAQLMGGEKQQMNKNSAGANGKDGVATSHTAVPAALVGTWHSGSLATANFYNPSTQQWSEPSGRGMFLIVQPSGEYCLGSGEQIVTTDYFLYQAGNVTANGSQMVLSPKMGSEYARDVCVTGDTDQRVSNPDEMQPATMKFQLVLDQTNSHSSSLVLINEDGGLVILQSSVQ